jgi:hypothetical protein
VAAIEQNDTVVRFQVAGQVQCGTADKVQGDIRETVPGIQFVRHRNPCLFGTIWDVFTQIVCVHAIGEFATVANKPVLV